ncbi:MAG: iron-sulfur cluster assembly accessory protein [Gammaproteobacteria bacterium]|jgi:iron-sulfur cluster assembly protein|nr:iron-sulfur cluster assembly accessory protein [Gammaproteobacteria bacterium]
MAITVTDSAASHIKGMLASRAAAAGLRVGLTKSGCSGFAYVLDFADAVGARDRVFESNGVRLVVDEENVPHLDGLQLDYVREGLNSTFKFHNPNVKAACGCGESVGF